MSQGADDQQKKHPRDVSPSAYSQSSGLEWDPSADVGTSHTQGEISPIPKTKKQSVIKSSSDPSNSKSKHVRIDDQIEKSMSDTTHSRPSSSHKSGSSSSMIFVEISGTRKPEKEFTTVGIQTSDTLLQTCFETLQETSDQSSVFHSTPTERYRNQLQGILSRKLQDKEKERNRPTSSTQERRRERSPPQPFAVASRKSSHRYHHANHSRSGEISSLMEANMDNKSSNTTTNSGELSPTCFLINKLTKPGKSPLKIKKEEMTDAIKIHQEYHRKKVYDELKQLRKINELLSKNLSERNRETSSSENNTSGSHCRSKKTETKPRRKMSPVKHRTPVKVKATPVASNSHSLTSDFSSTSNTTVKDSSELETRQALSKGTLAKICAQIKTVADENPENGGALERKLDKLLETFTHIAGMLIDKEDKENIPLGVKAKKNAAAAAAKPKSAVQTIKADFVAVHPKPKKPALAYFIPFPTCEGKYVFRKSDLEQCTPGSSKGDGHRQIDSRSKTILRQTADNMTQKSNYFPPPPPPPEIPEKENDTQLEIHEVKDADELAENTQCDLSGSVSGAACEAEVEEDEKIDLQEAFKRRHPRLVDQLKERQSKLCFKRQARTFRTEAKRDWVRSHGDDPDALDMWDDLLVLPPKGPGLMSSKEMRQRTENKYKRLPEVQERAIQRKTEEEKKTNRLMSQVFAGRLRKKALSGKVNHVHSRSLIR